jgi:hypothetical protein
MTCTSTRLVQGFRHVCHLRTPGHTRHADGFITWEGAASGADPLVSGLGVASQRAFRWFGHIWDRGFDNTGQETKMAKEVAEFVAEPSLDEAADVLITLIGSIRKYGWTVDDLARATQAKMEVNENRQWTLLDDGTYQHVKE